MVVLVEESDGPAEDDGPCDAGREVVEDEVVGFEG